MCICGLKDYIHSEIKLWNPKYIEDARHAEKLIELKDKFNRSLFAGPEAAHIYSNEKPNKYSTNKYNLDKKWVNKCRYCRDNWFLGHKCDNKNYILAEKRRNQTHPVVNQREREQEGKQLS
jgi:hypothetical protein